MKILFNISRIYFYIQTVTWLSQIIRDQLTSYFCVMFEVGAAVSIKRWVFIGSLRCLKWHRYDLRGCLQILSGVMKLKLPRFGWGRASGLAEVRLLSWQCGLCVLVIRRRVNTPVSASPLIHLCHCLLCVLSCVWGWHWACQTKTNTWDKIHALYPCSLIHYVEPHRAFTISFYVRS